MERTNIVAGRIGGQNLDALFFHPQPCLSPHRPGDLCAEAGPSGSTNGFRIPRVDGPIQDQQDIRVRTPDGESVKMVFALYAVPAVAGS